MEFSLKKMLMNRTLRQKLNILLGVTVLVMTICTLVSMERIKNIYREYLYNTIASQMAYSGQLLSDNLQTAEQISMLILSNDTVQKNMDLIRQSDDPLKRITATTELRNVITSYYNNFPGQNIEFINLYCGGYSSSNNSFSSSEVPLNVIKDIRGIAAVKDGSPTWVNDYSANYGLFLGREIRKIENLSLDPLGEVLICINMEHAITNATVLNEQYDVGGYLLFDGTTPIYHSIIDLTANEMTDLLVRMKSSHEIVQLHGHRYFAVSQKIPKYDWNSIYLISCDAIASQQFHAYVLMIAVNLVIILLLIFFVRLQITGITRHYAFLKEKMVHAAENPTSPIENICDYSNRKDEIAVIHQSFDQMLRQFNELIQKNYVNELQKKEAQLQALQSQINPHFLYNTLESINWRARALGAKDISEMVQALASLLRVTLNQGRTYLSISQELELLEHYMKIQQYRFEDRLHYTTSLSQTIGHVQIPCLCLQPLAENAIHYGLENNIDDCEIVIEAYEKKGLIHLIVKNTGSEFEDDLLEGLRNHEITPQRHGIALRNIDERIRLTYGDEYGLRVYNEDEWAVVEIVIPPSRED